MMTHEELEEAIEMLNRYKLLKELATSPYVLTIKFGVPDKREICMGYDSEEQPILDFIKEHSEILAKSLAGKLKAKGVRV